MTTAGTTYDVIRLIDFVGSNTMNKMQSASYTGSFVATSRLISIFQQQSNYHRLVPKAVRSVLALPYYHTTIHSSVTLESNDTGIDNTQNCWLLQQ